ncbi:MAG: H-NS histone family protein [Sulfitobacter sp.]
MTTDLKQMSRKQLEKHLKDVQKALQNVQARDRRQAKKAAEKAAAEFGFSLDDLSDRAPAPTKARKTKVKSPKTKSVPKFANPNDPKQTWTGKGRRPDWYRDAVDQGISPEAMAI